ncbi:DUF4762 family protein [Serratia rhizosphaerae]|uniref:DUF4762 family protein n=1 Tax=unclassified Serratia (in: enterobacteria) TaxID=2647522 RepID=UPI000CF64787|nr:MULTISPECIES: DUF4762 family protein [unclassified Serratia (in: enterobacteria)]MBU3894490.1 DUF4762 domain-containing protein [Serratia rubidaea]AVJ19058.1 hypothetical protein CLM71_18950 [Serratia sp. MYb239]MCA4824602.1 DUF4762 family protein [Serratia rubidaea]QNK33428.1 DUF4762 family protein [Serratia sp. JUb9]QPT13752.1 DUF4762 family protein [Serratia rubidaea]
MKKVTLSAAEAVIGGKCKKNCTDSFEWIGTDPSKVCTLVRSCTDKYGKIHQTSIPAVDENQCRGDG